MDDPSAVNRPALLNVWEAAEFLGIPTDALRRFASRRRIPCRKIGGSLFFLESELSEWARPAKDRRVRSWRYEDLERD
jgi:excisionase family DNA binding protein